MRDTAERGFKRTIVEYLQDQMNRVVEAYRLGLELEWEAEEVELLFTMLPHMHSAIGMAIVEEALSEEEIPGAIAWAHQRARDSASTITRTTRGAVLSALRDVAIYAATGVALVQAVSLLRSLLETVFAEVRAEAISITEITRAFTAATMLRADKYRQMGYDVTLIWETNRDYKVCPVCDALDMRRQGDGWIEGPPAHVNCRCRMTIEFNERV